MSDASPARLFWPPVLLRSSIACSFIAINAAGVANGTVARDVGSSRRDDSDERCGVERPHVRRDEQRVLGRDPVEIGLVEASHAEELNLRAANEHPMFCARVADRVGKCEQSLDCIRRVRLIDDGVDVRCRAVRLVQLRRDRDATDDGVPPDSCVRKRGDGAHEWDHRVSRQDDNVTARRHRRCSSR